MVAPEPEQPRLRIAGLRPRRHRADFDEAETPAQHGIGRFRILVETGRQPDRVGEIQIPHPSRQDRIVGPGVARRRPRGERADRQVMGAFRRQATE